MQQQTPLHKRPFGNFKMDFGAQEVMEKLASKPKKDELGICRGESIGNFTQARPQQTYDY
jgi:hypothetical protein